MREGRRGSRLTSRISIWEGMGCMGWRGMDLVHRLRSMCTTIDVVVVMVVQES